MEHYCNSTETENNIKPSLSKLPLRGGCVCVGWGDAIIKTSPRQRTAEKPLPETRLSDLSFSLPLPPSLCLRLFLSLSPGSLHVREMEREESGEMKWHRKEGEMV